MTHAFDQIIIIRKKSTVGSYVVESTSNIDFIVNVHMFHCACASNEFCPIEYCKWS